MSLGLKTPATVVQIRGIIVNAGLLAGVLALVTIYDLRRGAAQDLHRLEFNGMISRKVANALCHSYLSWKEAPIADPFVSRIQNTPLKIPKIRDSEVRERCRRKGLDKTVRNNRINTRHMIQKERLKELIENACNGVEEPAVEESLADFPLDPMLLDSPVDQAPKASEPVDEPLRSYENGLSVVPSPGLAASVGSESSAVCESGLPELTSDVLEFVTTINQIKGDIKFRDDTYGRKTTKDPQSTFMLYCKNRMFGCTVTRKLPCHLRMHHVTCKFTSTEIGAALKRA